MSDKEDANRAQHHIDEAEYNELMKGVSDSGLPGGEKDRQRELLAAGYRNLNGDPMETKVQLLARTDRARRNASSRRWKKSRRPWKKGRSRRRSGACSSHSSRMRRHICLQLCFCFFTTRKA